MTTCLLDTRARLCVQGGRLTVVRPDTAHSYLPLGQIDRLVIRATQDPSLLALLMLAEAGRPIHFISASGEPIAALTPYKVSGTPRTFAERLLRSLFRTSGAEMYRRWLDNQRSHTCSRLIRHTQSRDWSRIDAAVNRHFRRAAGDGSFVTGLVQELRGLLWAWLDSRCQCLGLLDVAEVLEGRDCRFQSDLESLLALPMKSWLTPIIRERPDAASDVGALFNSIEMRLDQRLWIHLNALSATLNAKAHRSKQSRE